MNFYTIFLRYDYLLQPEFYAFSIFAWIFMENDHMVDRACILANFVLL